MVDLVLVRHGESTWNKENRFTGWHDVPLSERGVEEALEAGRALAGQSLSLELVYTSVLKRAIKTLWLMLEQMDRMWLPVVNSWRLNERHYGALQGLDKAQTAARYGEAQVHLWRRSYDVPPPALERDDPRFPGHDPRYAGVDPAELPLAESLKDTGARFLPYWEGTIAPQLAAGRGVLICAHGNSLRALIKHLESMTEDEIVGLNLPTGIPKVYRLGADLKPLDSFYCGDPEALQAAIDKVESQGRAAGQSGR